jgi:hypothetical protein
MVEVWRLGEARPGSDLAVEPGRDKGQDEGLRSLRGPRLFASGVTA